MMKLRPFRHHATRDLTGRSCRGEGRTCWEPSADRGALVGNLALTGAQFVMWYSSCIQLMEKTASPV